jgi:hypothetical protein
MKIAVVCSGPRYIHPASWIDRAYLQHYEPDYNRGEGRAWFTFDLCKAVLFDTLAQAVAYVQRVPVNNKFRAGIINRPIDCFEITYEPLRGPIPRYRGKLMTQTLSEPGQFDYLNPWWNLAYELPREDFDIRRGKR